MKGSTNGYKRKGNKGSESGDEEDEDEMQTLLPLHTEEATAGTLSHPPSVLDALRRPKIQVGVSITALLVLPCFVYGYVPGSSPLGFYHAVINAWDSFLHMSIYLVATVTFLVACLYLYIQHCLATVASPTKEKKESKFQSIRGKIWKLVGTPFRLSVLVLLLFVYLSSVTSIQTLVNPGWLWDPFLLITNYHVIWPYQLEKAMNGICLPLNYKPGDDIGKRPLCLSEADWRDLSAGALSSKKPDDVAAVLDGIAFAQLDTSGLIVNVLARDVVDHVEQLQQNVQALSVFFPKLAVVIFENDSKDGSREAFQAWASQPNKGYEVDLMECEEAPDCKLKKVHRYDGEKGKDFFTSPSLGDMHKFRQRMLDYIISKSDYNNYSHMMQIDLDIGVSLSPLGVMHTIGKANDKYAVASSCRQAWAGGMGTLVPPYDFNAFQPLHTDDNKQYWKYHEAFCGLLPPNDIWQFHCVGASAVHFLQILSLDRGNDDLYSVASAYNGATLYPLQLIRKNNPKYDIGEYGHTCEHVAFNKGIDKQMYVNPKWDCHMSPTLPGGPRGERALKAVERYSSLPRVAIPLVLQTAIPLAISVFSVMTISVHSLRHLFLRYG